MCVNSFGSVFPITQIICISNFRSLPLKPIFHRKLGLRWLQNAKEINTKNMKCTCPTPAPTPEAQRHLYSTDWRRGLTSGVTQITPDVRVFTPDARVFTPDVRVCVGCKIPTCWYPERKILALGALPNANPRRQVFCVLVEYRLKSCYFVTF